MLNAIIFWLKNEIMNGLISADVTAHLYKNIESALTKLVGPERAHLESVWHSTKGKIEELSFRAKQTDESPVEKIIATELAQGELPFHTV